MKQIGTKHILVFGVVLLVIIALPTGAYAYKYNEYKNNLHEAIYQLDSEKYDESINAFSNISTTYFGKKNFGEIEGYTEKAKNFKENKKLYDDALKLFEDKKYLEAADGFRKVSQDDEKRNDLAKKKIDECNSLYISLNIESAKNEAKANNYDSAVNYLTLVLNLDSANKDALTLKEEYLKAKEAAQLKAKQEAEAKAKKEAEEKARKEAEKVTVVVKPPTAPQQTYTPTHVSGNEAIKNEFKKMGFVFQSDVIATYTKDNANCTLEYIQDGGEKGSCWAIYTDSYYYGHIQEQVISNALTAIWGSEKVSYNLQYVHSALSTGYSYSTPNIKALIYNNNLYVFIYLPK